MSKLYSPEFGTNDLAVADVIVSWTIGSSGAVTTTSYRGKHLTSVTKEAAAGTYTVLLDHDVYQVLFARAEVSGLATEDDPGTHVYIASETASPLSIRVTTFAAKGTATPANLATGRRIYLHLKCKMSAGA